MPRRGWVHSGVTAALLCCHVWGWGLWGWGLWGWGLWGWGL